MWQRVRAFIAKLRLFHQDVLGCRDYFPTLKTFIDESLDNPDEAQTACEKASTFISDMNEDFHRRFETCKKIEHLIDLIAVPAIARSGNWKEQLPDFLPQVKAAAVELELCDFLADRGSVNQLSTASMPALF